MSEKKMENMQEELKYKAMEHDVSDMPQIDVKEAEKAIETGVTGTYKKIEDAVVGGYKKIEDTVVGGYKKIEDGVVDGFTKMTDKFVEKLFTREGESVEEAKKRLSGEKQGEDK